jgi:Uma2 family endonuclease
MGTTTLISLEEYLNTSYEPDMDFVDGVLVRRNVGTPRHSMLQLIVGAFFRQFRKSHHIRTFTEARLRVNAATGRHRIPDVMVVAEPYQKEKVIVDVPLIIVEIKSPDDTFDDILLRCPDYEKMGVPHILVMDPDHCKAWRFVNNGLAFIDSPAIELTLPNAPPIVFPLAEAFAELDD